MINYYLLTKPGIILGNLITVAAGFLLASKGEIHVRLFLSTLLGLALIMASACVFNNYIDRHIDKKMQRTKDRPLVKGLVSGSNAIWFGITLGALGGVMLAIETNLLTVLVASLGFFVYVVLYSFWKCHTVYGTAIGSIAGAVPPVVGYCAVSNRFDVGALLLFIMLVLWQMPHFFSIAIYRYKDYTAAGLPVLPVKEGILKTKIHMLFYILAFIIVTALFTALSLTGIYYLIITTLGGLTWFALCLQGFKARNDTLWGKQMFRLSLILITAICIVIPFDVK